LNLQTSATVALLLAVSAACFGADLDVLVEAGGRDRNGTTVSFSLPASHSTGAWRMVPESGNPSAAVPVQVESTGIVGNNRGWFLVKDLPKGTSRKYRMEAATGPAPWVVRAITETNAVRLEVSGRPAFTYRTTPVPFPEGRVDLTPAFRRGGYIHPVMTPSGAVVTDDYPVNHRHHHGIWFAWSQAVFEGRKTDTWNMGDQKGTVEFEGLDTTWSGAVHGGFRSRHRQVDLTSGTPRVMLGETWNVRVFAGGFPGGRAAHVFDVDVTDRCQSDAPVSLPKYRYGGIGFRGNWAWNGAGKMDFLNSEGTTRRDRGDNAATVGRWAWMGGALGEGRAGLLVLGHPQNVHAPQPQRIHPDEPFLAMAPQQSGPVEITAERPLTLRYRIAVFDGQPDAAEIERLWGDYAEPPVLRVVSQ
jgi:hypothetical protein